ncbi:5'-nucleotidase C-terminal domain-containing protein [Chryseobacterium sp. SC28]|uniref:5'-nucleotidase C-terminal domain-containing protein n=1 Tax=Chryseobacterium sp. SC28 TaxID=2268028 RepID=UPI000F652DAB|nr:5'-nucleotidase C-terminal domain-containing protein [Chryseobacterium sp. SC28]RRQ46590.1 bifunctional NAD pyrophosphatase/5'-nucleotidase [Chryseobacterium sp. SC28]
MKNRLLGFGIVGLLMISCKTPLNVANIHTEKNIYITDQLKENEAMNAAIQPYKQELEGKMNTVISHTNVELTKAGDNSNLGNLLADYTFEGADEWAKKNNRPPVDAAVINIGGIRTIIPKGDIQTKQIYEVMPFENEIVIVKMSGKGMEGLFDYYLKTQKNNPVSHLIIETENGKLSQKLINGKAIDYNKTYYIATSDYLALGGDNMLFFGKGELISTGIKMRDLFLEKFQQNPEISAPNDVRLIFKNKKSEE